MSRIVLLGGSGFVGRRVASLLSSAGHEVRVLTRNREQAKRALIVLPTVEVVQADIHDEAELVAQSAGAHALINFVGILHERRRGDFTRAHVELTRTALQACARNGIARFIQVSSLGASADAPSKYLRSKGEAQQLVAVAQNLHTTIFRPSIIFGPGDSFLTLFAKVIRLVPVIALACPNARFQPVYIEDVARCIAASLNQKATFGRNYDLCGPNVYTLRQLIELVCKTISKRRLIIGLNNTLSYWQAAVMEFAPITLMTRDNYHSMQVDNVCDCPFPVEFGLQPAALETIISEYLGEAERNQRYATLRRRSGR